MIKISHVWVYTKKTKEEPNSVYITDYATNIEVESLEKFKEEKKREYRQNVSIETIHSAIISDSEFNNILKQEMRIKNARTTQKNKK